MSHLKQLLAILAIVSTGGARRGRGARASIDQGQIGLQVCCPEARGVPVLKVCEVGCVCSPLAVMTCPVPEGEKLRYSRCTEPNCVCTEYCARSW